MSFSFNGTTFVPQDAGTHALSALQILNQNLSTAGLPQVSQGIANVIWQYLLGAGSLNQTYDNQLDAAGNALNIAQCDPDQVLNCAPIAGVSLIPGAYSSLSLLCTATSAGSATIPAGTKAAYTNTVNFVVSTTTVIPAGTSVHVPTVADVIGPYQVTLNQINQFLTSIPNLASVTNDLYAIIGNYQETVEQLRARIISGNVILAGVNGATMALRALPGVTSAQVYFNPSGSANLTLQGGKVLLPREACIVIAGSGSIFIADTYAKYMTALTLGGDGSSSQNWITQAGQVIPVNYFSSTTSPFYVRVHYSSNKPILPGYDTEIQALVVSLNNYVSIGQFISAEWITQTVLLNFTLATITGVEVSLDGITWGYEAQVDADAIPVFTTGHTYVVTP